MIRPHPITLTVCAVCTQPWIEHLRLTEEWAFDDIDDVDEGYPYNRDVTHADCVTLLRRANQGPPGPPGPMGPAGSPTPTKD